ncbi:MAG: hypothetical protein B6229_08035 [Spirochaetaceae bacterium 4572_7]|nr:MAG: hypothetical protein B6229_08035 [Spirochaetaceae bacterium 4572_7]
MSQWIYSYGKGNRERYTLGEVGSKTLVCIGINPSTATPEKLDNTLTRVRSRALDAGYDSWIMLNVYPQRATDPNKLHKNIHLDSHRKNVEEIEKILKTGNYDIWAAWGTLIEKRRYLLRCLRDIVDVTNSNIKWYSVGDKSKAGHPHHPLYLKKELLFDPFYINNYLRDIIL